jgi:EmrB/QacA subfamily drug resistance transporter
MCAVIVLGAFMANLDTSLVNVGLSTISHSLHASLTYSQWVVSGYLLALAAALPACGWLSRRFGSAVVWLWALAAFAFTSGLCALAGNMTVLILMRILQGIAGGLLVPAGQTTLGLTAGPRRMGRVMSTVGISVALAPAIGPAVGGVLIARLSWNWLFLINLPVAALALTLGLRLFRSGKLDQAKAAGVDGFDMIGFALVAVSLPLLTYGLISASSDYPHIRIQALAMLGVGLFLLLAFVRHSVRSPMPLLNLRLFRNRTYTAAQCCGILTSVAGFGGLIVMPLYFEILRGESVIKSGLLLITYGLGTACGLRVGGRLSDCFGGGVVVVGGLVLTLVTTVPLVFLSGRAWLPGIETLQLIRGVGFGLCALPAMTTAYATVSARELPDAAAQANILQRVGGSMGSALFVVVLTSNGGNTATAFQATFLGTAIASSVALMAAVWLAAVEHHRWRRVNGVHSASSVDVVTD